MQKKAGVSISLKSIIGIVAAIVIILMIIGLWSRIYNIFVPSEDQATLDSFHYLADTIRFLLKDKNNFAYEQPVVYSTQSRYALIGFDKEWKDLSNKIAKPQQCIRDGKEYACLCLLKGVISLAKISLEPVECKLFDGEIILSGFFDEKNGLSSIRYVHGSRNNFVYSDRIKQDIDYDYLAFHGYYGLTNFYVEKYIENNKINIFVTSANKMNFDGRKRYVKERARYLQECGQDSDERCKDRHADEVLADGSDYYYCLYDKLISKCAYTKVDKCGNGDIAGDCICGDAVYSYGYCYNGNYSEERVNCDAYKSCGDYEDENICKDDPCGFKCKAEHVPTGKYTQPRFKCVLA